MLLINISVLCVSTENLETSPLEPYNFMVSNVFKSLRENPATFQSLIARLDNVNFDQKLKEEIKKEDELCDTCQVCLLFASISYHLVVI